VTWKRSINRALTRATGYELRKPRSRVVRTGDRLVERPAFILCTLRSGSTLLRVLLDSHSQLHAPHEIHLRYVSVKLDATWSERSMKEMGLDERALEYLLWDRLLHRELAGSGKPYLVDKTPNNVFIADRIKECWPDARFVFLLRHPAAIARSRLAIRPDADPEKNVEMILRYCEALEQARQAHDGLTVRYEDLTADPAAVTRDVCAFLGVPWEAKMLDYGEFEHGRFRAGLGDWADKIKSGKVQEAEPPPDEVPEPLRPVTAAWGYAAPAARVSAD
jgi:Sulfotransferase family